VRPVGEVRWRLLQAIAARDADAFVFALNSVHVVQPDTPPAGFRGAIFSLQPAAGAQVNSALGRYQPCYILGDLC
jgi:hypothetical protein